MPVIEHGNNVTDAQLKSVQRVLNSGVKFAAGSDMCWAYPGKTRGDDQCCRDARLARSHRHHDLAAR
jgi:hypothetical protein